MISSLHKLLHKLCIVLDAKIKDLNMMHKKVYQIAWLDQKDYFPKTSKLHDRQKIHHSSDTLNNITPRKNGHNKKRSLKYVKHYKRRKFSVYIYILYKNRGPID